MGKSPKVRKALKALGIKQDQPKELKGHEDATAPYRFKPGDERLKNNQGARIQLVPPGAVATQRKRMNELIKEYQHLPLAKELASALHIEGEPTLIEAVVMALFIQAVRGDLSATKLIQEVTERSPSGGASAGPPPTLRIKIVKEDQQPVVKLPPVPQLTEAAVEPEEVPPFADTKENT